MPSAWGIYDLQIYDTYSGWFSGTVITHAKGKRGKSGEDDFVKLANA
jgi:hypothetical protein